MAKSAVKTFKKTLLKCANDGTKAYEGYEALLNLRNTPRPGIGLKPRSHHTDNDTDNDNDNYTDTYNDK